MKTVLIAIIMSLSATAFAGTSAQDPNVQAIREAFKKADPLITNHYGWIMRLNCTRFSAETNNYTIIDNLFLELERSGLVFSRRGLPKNFHPEQGTLAPMTFVQNKDGLTSIVTPAKVKNPAYTAFFVFRIVNLNLVVGELSIKNTDEKAPAMKLSERSLVYNDKNVLAYYHCSARSNWEPSPGNP